MLETEKAAARGVVAPPDFTDEIRQVALLTPGIWTVDELRKAMMDRELGEGDDLEDELSFALSCLVAGHEAERLGFDSYRIYPRRPA